MCRFQHNESDQVFRHTVFPKIRKLIQQANVGQPTLQRSNNIYDQGQDLVYPKQSLLLSSRMGQNKLIGNPADQQSDLSMIGRGIHSKKGILSAAQSSYSVTQVASNRLHLTDFSPLFPSVRSALPGTCDWLLEIEIFKKWVSSPKDGILFIRGGQGQGKSVLSQYITQYVKSKNADDEITVVPFFCKTTHLRSSPVSILQHILYHVCQKHAERLLKVADERALLLGTSFDLKFYWDLLLRTKSSVKFSLFCVIDGLDEIISGTKGDSTRNIDSDLVDFLEEMCTKFNGDSEPTAGRLRVLFTTRPIKEVAQATSAFSDITIDIRRDDLEKGVAQMVDVDVKALAADKGLSPQIEALISEELKKRAGPMFQWAHAVLKDLRRLTFNVDAFESYREYLEHFRPENIDDTYEEVLRSIRDDTSIPEADQTLLRLLIRIVVFAEMEFDIEDMQYALACMSSPLNPQGFISRIPHSLESRIETSCGSLLEIDRGSIRLAHQSVGTFLQEKVPADLSMFDCKDIENGHLFMAQLCLHYLRLYRRLEISDRVADDSLGDMIKEQLELPFVAYALVFWTDHVRKCGLSNPGNKIWPILYKFFNDVESGLVEAQRMYLVAISLWRDDMNQDAKYIEEVVRNTAIDPPSIFLAEHDLLQVYKTYTAKVPLYKRLLRRKYQRSGQGSFRCHAQDKNVTQQTALHFAAVNGSVDFVKVLLNEGASGQAQDSAGKTPFWLALNHNNWEVAELLIKRNQAYKEETDSKSHSSMQLAAQHGTASIVEEMAKHNFEVNDSQGWHGGTPLLIACLFNKADTAKILLKNGACPSLADDTGLVPLHFVAEHGDMTLLAALFQAKPDLDPAPRDKKGMTPLLLAAAKGHLDVFSQLLARKPRLYPNDEGELPLHAVARGGNPAMLREIFRVMSDGDLAPLAKNGRTPLHLAALHGHVEIFQILTKRCGKVQPDEFGMLPIHLAAMNDHKSIITLCSQTEFEALTKDHRTPLYIAAENGNLDLVNFFIEETGKTEARAQDYSAPKIASGDAVFHISPLAIALKEGHEDVAKLFIERGADVDKTYTQRQTYLHLAVNVGNLELVKRLVELGLDPMAKDDAGDTPFHSAACDGKQTIVEYFLELWAEDSAFDIDQLSNAGLTALMSTSPFPIIRRLLKSGANPFVTDVLDGSVSHYVVPSLASSFLETWFELTNAEVTSKDRYDNSILHMCAYLGKDPNSVEILLRKGASLNAKNWLEETPIFNAALEGSIEVFNAFLRLGADPFQKDARGRSIEDYINSQHPAWNSFQSFKRQHDPCVQDVDTLPLEHLIVKNFRYIEGKAPLPRLEAWRDYHDFAILFLNTRRDEVTRILLESSLGRMYDGDVLSQVKCSDCEADFLARPMHLCRSCYDYRLCHDCFNERKGSKEPGRCPSNHEYLEYGGDEWWNLPEGMVNEEGQTIQEWFEQLKVDFRKEHGFTDEDGVES